MRAVALLFLAASCVVCGCATTGVGDLRFANRAPVWKVNDRVDIAKPKDPGFPKLMYFFDRFAFRRVTRLMELPLPRHAGNVNSLDEVPDSTWFQNRIGMRDLSVEDVRRGPNADGGPDRSKPLVIDGTKVGGVTVGFVITDSRGERYLLKFDRKGLPETETGANVVIQRLLWAAGFNVPEDTIITVTRDQMVLAKDAEVADTFGNKRPMKKTDLDEALARVNVSADGSFRALASKLLPGVPVGGVKPEGTREDDVNDAVPHQERRELRGQYVIFSWLDHTDVKYDNMLDMWSRDPENPSIHYLLHYLVDFGNGLGTLGVVENRDNDGYAYAFDFEYALYSLAAVGLWRRPWEGVERPDLVGVGRIDAEHFDPENWRPQFPWTPFDRRDRYDGFWGAKIVARFTPEMIRAAVEEGNYSDPRATEYLTRTLIGRRAKIVSYWFAQVDPLDRFEVSDNPGSAGATLCFTDLALVYGLSPAARAEYSARVHDYDGSAISEELKAKPDTSGRACFGPIPAGGKRDGYAIVKIVPRRLGASMLPVEAHLAKNPAGRLRVIGVHRW